MICKDFNIALIVLVYNTVQRFVNLSFYVVFPILIWKAIFYITFIVLYQTRKGFLFKKYDIHCEGLLNKLKEHRL